MYKIEESIGRAATKIAQDIEANCIISVEQMKKVTELNVETNYVSILVTIFRRLKKGVFSKKEYLTKVRKVTSGSVIPLKEILMEGITKKYVEKGDRVVCVQNESMGSGFRGLLFIFDVDKIFFDISTHNLAKTISADVIEAALSIALELGREGREGKKVGTAFIIGDKNEILNFTRQLIFNPFMGYSEEKRVITDPDIRETIKEFSQLDGVFIINKDGVVVTSGTYLDIETSDVDLPPGFGTRHRNCAAITKKTDSIAITVSGTGGNVRVFKEGKIVMKLQ